MGTWSSGFRRTFAMNCGLVRVLDKRLMMLLPYFCATRPAGELYIRCIPFKLEKGISIALTSARFCARARRRFSPISRIREMHLVR